MTRGTRELVRGSCLPFADGAFTLFGGPSHVLLLGKRFLNPGPPARGTKTDPHNPNQATLAGLTPDRFGLFRVRSPLLTESQLLSLPQGTEMVHFPWLASLELCIHSRMTEHYPCRVTPFGHPRINACLRLPRLFAACHVLHSLSAPRHPPCTLSSLTKLECLSLSESYRLDSIQLSKNSKLIESALAGVPTRHIGRGPLSYEALGGADRDRTDDIRLAKAALSQLSYSPIRQRSVDRPRSSCLLLSRRRSTGGPR